MSFEGWCFHHQISELTDLAKAFPDTTIILDHFGGPLGIGPYAGKRDEVLADWKKKNRRIGSVRERRRQARRHQHTKVNGFEWHKNSKPPTSEELCEATRPYYEYTIEQFGVDRCLFESNFPVDKISCSYHTLWNSFKVLTANYSAGEKTKLYHDNSARVYRL